MTQREIRMRIIEALCSVGGISESSRLVRDGKILEEWIMDAEDKAPAPRGRPKKD